MGFEFEIADLQHMSLSFQSERRDPYGVEAFAYYGSFGLIDPKAPIVDAPATASALGIGYWGGLVVAVLTGVLVAGTIGWTLDPAHKHDRGFDEYYGQDGEGIPWASSGGYEEQPSDMNW